MAHPCQCKVCHVSQHSLGSVEEVPGCRQWTKRPGNVCSRTSTQQQCCYLLLCAKSNSRKCPPVGYSGACFWWHEHFAWGPSVLYSCSQTSTIQLNWHLLENTRTYRFTISAPCSEDRFTPSICDRHERAWRYLCDACNTSAASLVYPQCIHPTDLLYPWSTYHCSDTKEGVNVFSMRQKRWQKSHHRMLQIIVS